MLSILKRVFLAIESNFQPANTSGASADLFAFITTLSIYFTKRVHLER